MMKPERLICYELALLVKIIIKRGLNQKECQISGQYRT